MSSVKHRLWTIWNDYIFNFELLYSKKTMSAPGAPRKPATRSRVILTKHLEGKDAETVIRGLLCQYERLLPSEDFVKYSRYFEEAYEVGCPIHTLLYCISRNPFPLGM